MAETNASRSSSGWTPAPWARGRRELLAQDVETERVRRKGAGRLSAEKTPEVIAAIEALLEYDRAGDPIGGVQWTRRTTRKIARELKRLGIEVCPKAVAKILKQLKFRCAPNHKTLSRRSDPDRDEQFRYIAEQRERFAHAGQPIGVVRYPLSHRPADDQHTREALI